ncbi:band 4.1-like protein 4B [Dendropsophus ebraccatus]|uniref:band 4.1-like protein 4B n=1 Tax=Dendropsophus ebraccatus TaxID=150705 RepID=UPI003831DE95
MTAPDGEESKKYPLSPGLKNSDLHLFNVEENGGTPFTSKVSGRHNHHHQHHHHHHHSSYGHLATESKEKTSGSSSTSKVSTGVLCLYEDTSGHLKKADVETTKIGSPWPALRINTNKVEEQKLHEKPLHSPLSPPSSASEHMKCNILKAQMDAAFRVGPQVGKEDSCGSDFSKSPSLQDTNVRSPAASLRAESTQSTGSSSSKQEVRPARLKKLTRQYSFNHSDEDDLPPALAAVAAESAAEQRAALLLASSGNSQASSIEKSPNKASGSFTLEPGDLLMDFTEATPMIKAYPADPSNSFFDPYTTVQQYPVDLLDTPLQQYSAEPSPKRLSPSIHMATPRQLMNQAQAMQPTHSLHTSKVDSSEALRRELEREKMMKRLLMTEL